METPEKIYELVKAMPAEQVTEVLDFIELLQHKAQIKTVPSSTIFKRTLTGLREITKVSETFTSNEEIREEHLSINNSSKTLDFRQAAGLGQQMWSRVEVEEYIQQERAAWD